MVSRNEKTKSGLPFPFRKIFFRWIGYTFLGLILLGVDPFNVGSYAELGSQRVLYELGGPIYSSEAQSDITIVLVTENSLKALYDRNITGTNEWPLLYRDWAVLFRTIAVHNPRALFIDVYFEQERVTDASLPSFESALERLDGQLPIYLAAGIPPYDSKLLQRLNRTAGLAGSTWQGFGHGVPLIQDSKPMASLQLYREACGKNVKNLPGCSTSSEWTREPDAISSAMSVVWGSKGALPLTAELEGYSSKDYCSNSTASFSDLALGVLRSALGDLADYFPWSLSNEGRQCLFHQVIDAEELLLVFDYGSAEEKAVLKDALENKIVMLGTFFDGLPDVVDAPTMGLVPGVAQHAMMLDNLMKYGTDYVRTSGLGAVPYNVAVWSAIVFILVMWMAWREKVSDTGIKVGKFYRHAPFTGWDSTIFLVVSFLLTVLAAFFTFYILRFEPANAIGFMALAELTRRIYGKPKE